MSERKPWEETWVARDDYSFVRIEDSAGRLVLSGEPTADGQQDLCGEPGAITLAAAAPELYRALARYSRWTGLLPCCHGSGSSGTPRHKPGCYVWVALDKARGGEAE